MSKKDYELAYEYIYYLLKLDEDSMSFPVVINSLEALKELVDQTKTPTEEEIIKEWEELGYEVIEDNNIRLKFKKGLSTIQILKIKKIYRKVIGLEEDNRGNFLTLQEHQLLTKTFKMLGWEENNND